CGMPTLGRNTRRLPHVAPRAHPGADARRRLRPADAAALGGGPRRAEPRRAAPARLVLRPLLRRLPVLRAAALAAGLADAAGRQPAADGGHRRPHGRRVPPPAEPRPAGLAP